MKRSQMERERRTGKGKKGGKAEKLFKMYKRMVRAWLEEEGEEKGEQSKSHIRRCIF